jgi:4-hydroxy-tetrahydrodipicolinate synthase
MGSSPQGLGGLWPAIATAFLADGTIDPDRIVALGKRLLGEGARGLVVLGTTGEAASIGLAERHTLIDAVTERGLNPGALIVGAGAPSVGDAAEVARHAADVGAAAILLLPPFYFKPVTNDGLFAFVADLIRRMGQKPVPIVLYHYPALAGVGWSIEVIAALAEAFPDVIAGVKDSSGDHAHTLNLITAFSDLGVFSGSESHIVEEMAAGAAGMISANANVNARNLASLVAGAGSEEPQLLAEANAVRTAMKARGLVPSIKAVLARQLWDEGWANIRPPLTRLTADARTALYNEPAIAQLLKVTAAA